MSAVDINGTALNQGDPVLVLFGTIARIDAATNRAYLSLPDGQVMYADTLQLEKVTTSIASSIATAIFSATSSIFLLVDATPTTV